MIFILESLSEMQGEGRAITQAKKNGTKKCRYRGSHRRCSIKKLFLTLKMCFLKSGQNPAFFNFNITKGHIFPENFIEIS